MVTIMKMNPIELKEVIVNLKNHDFDTLGHYRMDQKEAQKLMNALDDLIDTVHIITEGKEAEFEKVYSELKKSRGGV